MRYFATAAAGSDQIASSLNRAARVSVSAMSVEQPGGIEETPVERKVLASNPIMEV